MWSEFWVAYWFILFFLAMFVDAAVVLTLAFAASRRRWILSAYSHGCLLAACALIVYINAWLSHPVYDSVRGAAALTAERPGSAGPFFPERVAGVDLGPQKMPAAPHFRDDSPRLFS